MYTGSFDPMTFGHLDVIRRGRRLFDRLVLAVGHNPSKPHLFTLEERVDMARSLVEEVVAEEPDEADVDVRGYTGLTVDFARRQSVTALLRGVRNLSDLQNEVQQAMTNREVAGLETVFVVAGPTFAYTSSTLIKQITAMGEDLSSLAGMVPRIVIDALGDKKRAAHPLLESLASDRHDDD